MLRKFFAFSILLLLICATLSVGVVSAAGAAHLPVLMFSAIRPDGDLYGGDLYLYDLHHQLTLRLTIPDIQGFEQFAVMSPDRQQLALTSAGSADSELGLMQLDQQWQLGDEFVTLLRNNPIDRWYMPAWSPQFDGNTMQLAFATNIDPELESYVALDFDIWVYDVPVRRWQPDDLLLTGTGRMIPPMGLTILQTGRRLTDDDYYDYEIAWSPDGSQMAFASDRDQNFEIYLLDTSGVNQNIRRITHHLAADRHPTWSPDG